MNTAVVQRDKEYCQSEETEGFVIEIACNLHAKTKGNCIPFLLWMSLVLHIAP